MAKEKEQSPTRPIILDNYRKSVLNTLMFVLILTLIIPVAIFVIIKPSGATQLSAGDTKAVYEDIMTAYDANRYNEAKLTITEIDMTNITAPDPKTIEYYFNEGVLTSITTTEGGSSSTVHSGPAIAAEAGVMDILDEIRGNALFIGGFAEISYNMFGLGYIYGDLMLIDASGNTIVCAEGKIAGIVGNGNIMYGIEFIYTNVM